MLNDDYIKRIDAFFAVCGHCKMTEFCEITGDQCCDVKRIEAIPAADVEPVVRCRDCKFKPTAPDGITNGFQVEFPDEEHNLCPCQCEDGWYSWMPPDDFFCAYGAKMDKENENDKENL